MRKILFDVDTQRDFCEPDGALCVPEAPNDVFRRLTRWAMEQRIPIVGSVDSHAFDAWEFASNDHRGPKGEDPGFPDHCVKGTAGWLKVDGTLPQRFRLVPNVSGYRTAELAHELAEGIAQGVYFEKEVYSLFANPSAEPFVAQLIAACGGKCQLLVYGVATDYCVSAAALGLAERGYQTALITDAVAGISPEGVAQALGRMRAAGIEMITTDRLLAE